MDGLIPSGCERLALTLLIASEVRFLRECLTMTMSERPTVTVLGSCEDSADLVRMSRALSPDLVLLDAAARDGTAIVRRLRSLPSAPRVVVFAVSESIDEVLGWAEAGVAGYIPSTAAIAELHGLVADIGAGKQACSPAVASGLLRRLGTHPTPVPSAADPSHLTPRELEIARLISIGLSNKEIARRLDIGVATTKSHVHNLLAKLNLQRRGQAATWMHIRAPLA